MTMRSLLVFTTLAASMSMAAADTTATTVSADANVKVAVAVNPPIRWFTEEKAFAGSLYVAVSKHHVLRGNLAVYPREKPLSYESRFDGTITDYGASYMYFPRTAFRGYFLEAGLLYRSTDSVEHDPFGDDTTTKTRFSAGRAMIGYSAMIGAHVFMSFQLGMSLGYRNGTETFCQSACMDRWSPVITPIEELSIAGEAFVRIGAALDLGS
jgi:hypothetical protein